MRSSRYLCWWRNSLRRRTDRVESLIAAGLLVLLLAAGPLAVILARHEYSYQLHQAESIRALIHPATATLTADSPRVSSTAVVTEFDSPMVAAEWTDANGQILHGKVPAEYGDHKGTEIPVWLDAHGGLTDPPDDAATIKADAIALAIGCLAVCGLVLEGVRRLARRRLDRGRLQAWEDEWRYVGPQWTRRRG